MGTFFIERSEANLRKTVGIFNHFWEILGLKCNIGKTKIIPVGVFEGENICLDLKLSWENNFTILGMEIDNKLKSLSKKFEIVYNKTRSIINRKKPIRSPLALQKRPNFSKKQKK